MQGWIAENPDDHWPQLHLSDFMHRHPYSSLVAALLVAVFCVPTLGAQHLSPETVTSAPISSGKGGVSGGGFAITNAAGDTLFLAQPDHLIRMGDMDSLQVYVGRNNRGLDVYRYAEKNSGIVSILADPDNNAWGVYGQTAGLGAGVTGFTSVSYVPGNWGSGVLGYSSDSGLGVTGYAAGTGIGGYFFSRDKTETRSPALVAETDGIGSAFIARRWSADPNVAIALFGTGRYGSEDEAYWAGIQGNGDIWTRGNINADGNIHARGTITSEGADFAERFAVVGSIAAYTPGDVLQISHEADRHLERTAEPYSRRIAGVYATKPGVLLGTLDSATSVPLGVVGVIPTKVTNEGGPIRRGDLLVTSSTPGHAMKGDPDRIGVGMVIGRALQDFDGAETGMIEVLVNVQ